MTDWGSNRKDRYEFVFCDPFTLKETGPVDVEPSSSAVAWDYYSDNVYSGSVTLIGQDSRGVGKDRLIRVKQVTEVAGEEPVASTLATMFVASCSGRMQFGMKQYKAKCHSTLYRFTQDSLINDYNLKKGANVVNALKYLVTVDGGKLRILDGVPTSSVLAEDYLAELGRNRREVMAELAGKIDCMFGCDPEGYVTLEPIVDPAKKPVKYHFEAGANCTYVPGVDEEDNRADIVNRVVVYYTREKASDGYPLTDRVCVELGEESSFCFKRCGRYQTEVIKLTEPCSKADLKNKAQTYLRENSGEKRYYTIEHVSIPGLTVGDVVQYDNSTDFDEPVSVRAMIVGMDMRSLEEGALCTSKIAII